MKKSGRVQAEKSLQMKKSGRVQAESRLYKRRKKSGRVQAEKSSLQVERSNLGRSKLKSPTKKKNKSRNPPSQKVILAKKKKESGREFKLKADPTKEKTK